MTNAILKGLAGALYLLFGDECAIYPDEVIQELIPPCILISEVTVVSNPLLYPNKKKDRAYVLQYFPVSEASAIEECREAAGKIIDELDLIQAGDQMLRCTNLHYSIDREQQVANITLNINTITWKDIHTERMDEFSAGILVRKR